METTISCLTPPGKAAIATLAVRGPLAWGVTSKLFQPHRGELPCEPAPGRFWFGRLGAESRDEVILAVKERLPASLELHCHGGIAVVDLIKELYQQAGIRIVSWQEFMLDTHAQRADGVGDAAELLVMLAQAPTTRTADILLTQAQGAWKAIQDADGPQRRRLQELIPLGQHVVEPWKAVIAGAPNVGKSSLMNALAGYTRSIVSPLAGTTRDVVRTSIAIDGWPIDLFDTAGLRESCDDLEHQGMGRAHAAIGMADLRLWLLDGSTTPVFPADGHGWRFLINKIDLPPAWNWTDIPGAVRISAHTKVGIAELCEAISRWLVPHPPRPGEAVPCLSAQFERLRLPGLPKE